MKIEGVRPQSNLKYAVPAVLLASFIYAVMSALVKIEVRHLSIPAIMFWRYFVSLGLYSLWLGSIHKKEMISLKVENLKFHFLRVGTSLGSVLLYFISLQKLSVATANLMFNTLPLFVPLVAFFWKGVKIYHRLWWGLGLAFVGLILALNPEGTAFELSDLLAILSGLLGAISVLSLRFAHYRESSYRLNFHFFALALLLTTPLTILTWKTSWLSLEISDLIPLLGIGVCGFIYQLSFTLAAKYAPIRYLGPFLYSSVIWGILFDLWIWKTEISAWMIYGMVLIILGNIVVCLLYPKHEL